MEPQHSLNITVILIMQAIESSEIRKAEPEFYCCNGMPFHWRSNKQPDTAMSSAAAEIVAMSECMKDVRLRMWIAEEIGIPIVWPAEIQVDNKAGVNFQNKMNPDSKLKGVFDMRLGWLKELHDKQMFKAVKVCTSKNLADSLTKPLTPVVMEALEKELKEVQKKIVLRKQ